MKSPAAHLQETNDKNVDLILGIATLSAVLVRVFSLVWDSSKVGSPRFFILTSMVLALVVLYWKRKQVNYHFKFSVLVVILLAFFSISLFYRALFSTLASLLVSAPLFLSFLTSHRRAVAINITMLVIFLSIGAYTIYIGGLQVDPDKFFLNPWNWFNDAIIMSSTTVAVLLIGRTHHRKLRMIHHTLAERQQQLSQQAAELRWRKQELEAQVNARSEALNNANQEIYDSNLLIAEKNLEIAWQNEEMEKTVAEIRRIEQDLVESDKLASIGTFAQGISQNITGPLAVIRAEEKQLRAMIAKAPDGQREKLMELGQILVSGIDRIDRIINDLGRMSSSDPDEVTDLEKTISSAVQGILSITAPHIRITMDDPDMPLTVRGNAARIERIFINLLTNSCHALEDSAEGSIRVRSELTNGWIIISVEDNGHGISPENLTKVKEPFFTTKEPGKGTGLGLFLCQSLMHDIGGRLEITSEEGKGTRVMLMFPAHEADKP